MWAVLWMVHPMLFTVSFGSLPLSADTVLLCRLRFFPMHLLSCVCTGHQALQPRASYHSFIPLAISISHFDSFSLSLSVASLTQHLTSTQEQYSDDDIILPAPVGLIYSSGCSWVLFKKSRRHICTWLHYYVISTETIIKLAQAIWRGALKMKRGHGWLFWK